MNVNETTVTTAAVLPISGTKKRKANTAAAIPPKVDTAVIASAGAEDLEKRQEAVEALEKPTPVEASGRKKKAEPIERPCSCGCSKPLVTTNAKRLFHQGHDATAKSLLLKVIEGKESPSKIAKITVENMDGMNFLTKAMRMVLISRRQQLLSE